MRNVLTVDVEDWYHDAEGLGGSASSGEPRVERNVAALLALFAEGGCRATFFILGEVAERFPDLVRTIVAADHEVASHGYRHRPVRDLLRREFRTDVERSLGLLADVSGRRVAGYRAPYFSIRAGVHWPAETLAELGVAYDSSVLPIDRAPGLELVTPRGPHRLPCGVWEVPVAIARYGFWHLPLLGGFALRTLPYRFVARRLADFNREIGPAVVHLHPWEIDPQAPESGAVPALVRGFKRVGRRGLVDTLARLFREHAFGSIAEVFPQVVSPPG